MGNVLEGTIRRVRVTNPDNHWTVASLEQAVRGPSVTLVGTMPALAEGMKVRAHGTWVEDPRYGRQWKVERYEELVPATREGLSAYLASGFIHGIGQKMATRIVDCFGEDALRVIREEPARLNEVQGLGAKRVASIVDAVEARRGAQEALIFLYGLGLTPGLANKIYKRYADDTVRVVRNNPYILAEEVHGIGFLKADQVAHGMHIAKDHPSRIRAGCYHVLNEARGDGHCFVTRSVLASVASGLLGVDEEHIAPAITSLAMDRRIIIDQWSEDPTEEAIYATALHEAEAGVAYHLAQLLGPAPSATNVEARVANAEATVGVALSDGQRAAVSTVMTQGSAIITGGPGTGKTTIIRTLLEALQLPTHHVALAAPTGRAAKRMSEATGREAKTIHRLLEFSPADAGFQRNEEDPLEVRVVIIDEASMVDIPLMHALVRAIPSGARLVLVGDSDQLPPVGPGSPFKDLIRSKRFPVARLDTIFRQGRDSLIIHNAHQVNRGQAPEVTPPKTPLQDFYFIEREQPQSILQTMEMVITTRIPERFNLDPVRDVQVLAPMRAGLIGVENLNLRLQELLNPEGQELTVGRAVFRTGDKVMQIRNDYERGVFNGDMGIVQKVDRATRRVLVAIDDRTVVYEKASLDDLVLAYAISVHKSQGSEYPAVVMPVSTQHFKMLQRNVVYTGITRGKSLVVLVGTSKAMGIAVRNSHVAFRNSQLNTRLTNALEGKPW